MTTNTNISPIQGSKTPTGRNTPELSKYILILHFPELQVAGTTIPAGITRDTVWAVSKWDAIIFTAKQWRMAKRVEVVG